MFMLQHNGLLWSRSFLSARGPAWKEPACHGWAPLQFGNFRDAQEAALTIERHDPSVQVEII